MRRLAQLILLLTLGFLPGLPASTLRHGPAMSGATGTEVTDALGNKTFYKFTDVQGELANLKTKFNSEGSFLSAQWMTYYKTMEIHHGALEGQTGHLGKESFEFDLASGLSLRKATDISGNTTEWTFDDALEDGAQAPVSEDNPLMSVWADPTSKTDALGHTETYTYGPYRVMTSSVDALGNKSTTEVDALGRPTRLIITDASNTKLREETLAYHATFKAFVVERRVKAFASASASGAPWEQDMVTRYVPDSCGRGASEIVDPDGLNLTTEHTYDANNNRLSTRDPRGNVTLFQYDTLNRLTQVTHADGATLDYVYDEDGNCVAEIDENGVSTLREFDGLHRLVREAVDMNGNDQIDAADLVTTHSYNAVNAPTAATDPNGNTTTMAYDALQRLTATTDALGQETTYEYGPNSGAGAFDTDGWKPTLVTDPRGYRTEVTYDELHRPVAEKVEFATDTYATTTKTYDAAGRLVGRQKGLGGVLLIFLAVN